jgi:hypothetical protein
VAALDPQIADVARRFVLLRLTRMRGVNLDLFDFDYDLTWMAFFLAPDGRVLVRYGGRDAASADGRVSLAGLRYSLQAALREHARQAPNLDKPAAPRTVEQLPTIRRLPPQACVHCHQVYDLRREHLQAQGKWSLDQLWVYPLPDNVGLQLEVDRGNVIAQVALESPAAGLGLQRGDELTAVNGIATASQADVQYGLHRAPAQGQVPLRWRRQGRPMAGALELPAGWRKTDLSWRWSLRGVDPTPWVQGEDLGAEEKQALGLGERRLAIRQGPFVAEPARQAGVRPNDIILGVAGKELQMTARQFGAYVRLHYQVGDTLTFMILRDGKQLEVPLRLSARAITPAP